MAQLPLLTIGVWQKKSSEVFARSKDRLVSAASKGFDAMAALLSKDSDTDEIHSALDYLSFERSIALKYDKAKDDSLRDVMYDLLECLHVSLSEWTEERNQKKETGEISTQTEEESILSLEPSYEASLPIYNNTSNNLLSVTNPPDSFLMEQKEESNNIDHSLPSDYQIPASELMRDEMMFKEEEMDNENTSLKFTPSLPFNSVADPTDISQILPRDNRMLQLNTVGDVMNFFEEDAPNDYVNSGMGDAVGNTHNGPSFNDDNSAPRMISGDLPLTEKNPLNEGAMRIKNIEETVQADKIGEQEQFDLPANDMIDDRGEEEEAIDHITVTQKETSETTKVEKRGRPSRGVSRPVLYSELMEDSDGDTGPSVKKSRTDYMKNDANRRSYKGDNVSKESDTELECPECEYRTRNANAWMSHLRSKHDTTPTLAGLALLCECGTESLSDKHSSRYDHANTTVIRKRDGPIGRLSDSKATPQCVLCEAYPRTAGGYAHHLNEHHKSTLKKNAIYLMCSCGLEIRSDNRHIAHLKDCNPRQFTLHKLDDE